jgi:predicted nucleic acid-binding protein
MKYLLDTNIISELRKKTPNQNVVHFIQSVDSTQLYLSCVTIGEIRWGVLKRAKTDFIASQSILRWLEDLTLQYMDQILTIDLEICKKWAEFLSIDSTNAIDSLIAAQAVTMNMTLVTRNVKHIEIFDVNYLNPFDGL